MKITDNMVNAEILKAGKLLSKILKPTLGSFKRFNFLMKLIRTSKIKGFDNRNVYIPSRDSDRSIRATVHQPKQMNKPLPGVLCVHGGGYALNRPETETDFIEDLLNTRDCIVVTPDYRLSINTPFPAAFDDCCDTLRWMKKNAAELNISANQLIVVGASAGGGMTAAVCMYFRDEGDVNIAFQMPLYPMLDDKANTPSMLDNNGYIWDYDKTVFAWDLYLGDINRDQVPYYAAPTRCKDLSNLPPAFTFVGDIDPFYDETVSFVQGLKDAGVKTEFKVFKGCYHAFERMSSDAKISNQALQYIKECFAFGVDNYFAKQPE